jgi:hypothetical protein
MQLLEDNELPPDFYTWVSRRCPLCEEPSTMNERNSTSSESSKSISVEYYRCGKCSTEFEFHQEDQNIFLKKICINGVVFPVEEVISKITKTTSILNDIAEKFGLAYSCLPEFEMKELSKTINTGRNLTWL